VLFARSGVEPFTTKTLGIVRNQVVPEKKAVISKPKRKRRWNATSRATLKKEKTLLYARIL
jgi:hypothetical protein